MHMILTMHGGVEKKWGIDKKTEHVNPSRQIFWGVHSVWCIVYEKVLEWSEWEMGEHLIFIT